MKASNWLNILLAAGLVSLAILLVTDKSNSGEAAEENSKSVEEAVIECIMTRTSVREYADRQIPDSVVETLLKAGMAAPTAMNKQPWQFIVVTDPKIRQAISDAGKPIRAKDAPLVIVACGDLSKEDDGPAADFWVQDLSAATENILLAAHAQGLGAVWCGIYPMQDRVTDIAKILQLPENLVPLSAICIGYPKGEQHPKDKWNPKVIHYNTY